MTGPLLPDDSGNGVRPGPCPAVNSPGTIAVQSPGQPVKVAFYGRTNRRGPEAATDVARQLELCRAVIGEYAQVARVFFDSPEPPPSRLPVSGGGGLRREGGWDTLAAAMTVPAGHRGFAAVICMTARSMSRRVRLLDAREKFAGHHGVPVLYADELADPEPHRALIRQICRSPASSPPGTAGDARISRPGTSRRPLRREGQVTG